MESNDASHDKQVPHESRPQPSPGPDAPTDTVSQSPASDEPNRPLEINEVMDRLTVTDETSAKSRFEYSKEQLIAISKLSSARIRPKCLDNAFNNEKNGLWNPEKWISSRSPNGFTPTNKYKKGNEASIRGVEEDIGDIVLSPQRGSFGTGCHVSSNSFGAAKTEPRNKGLDDSLDSGYRPSGRKIGTGRVVPKDTRGNKEREWSDRPGQFRGSGNRNDAYNQGFDRPNRGRRDDRRSNFEMRGRDYRNSRDEEEEPEWFTGGPTSKLETIELRGFEDESDDVKDNKNVLESAKSQKNDKEANDVKQGLSQSSSSRGVSDDKESKSEEFDVNACFKNGDWFSDSKTISKDEGISDNGQECDTNLSSRFKRWFQEKPNQEMNSQKNETNVSNTVPRVPTPGAMSSATHVSSPVSPESIFRMLQGRPDPPKIADLPAIHVDQLENQSNAKMAPQSSDNKTVPHLFEKIFAQTARAPPQVQRFPDKDDAIIYHNAESSVVVPKHHQQTVKERSELSILDMLREAENKEAMADYIKSRMHIQQPDATHMRSNGVLSGHNAMPSPHNSAHAVSNGPNHMGVHNWPKSAMMNVVRPNRPNEMTDQTNHLLQNAILKRQQSEMQIRPQSLNDNIRANTPGSPARSLPNANFFTPTSVMRNMHSERDKSLSAFNDMTSESNSSQHKFLTEVLTKPSPMRPIVKSNNPIGQSMAVKKPVMHSDPLSFATNSESALNSLIGNESQMVHQLIQNSSPLKSYPRSVTNANVRPFGLDHNPGHHNSPHSPNTSQANRNILQMFGQSNVRPNTNQMSINQMMALQHNSNEGRQSQYPFQRPITASSVQHMPPKSKFDMFFDAPAMAESDALKAPLATTYPQQRLQLQPQLYQSQSQSRTIDPRILGQIFGEDKLRHSLPEMPAVPVKNALKLEDLERV